MNIFQKVTSTLLSLSLLGAGPVQANQYEEHRTLIDSLKTVGVEVLINDVKMCRPEMKASGLYSPKRNLLIICQDRRSLMTSKEVEWTSNDYDTLRHESHHVIQDCVAGFHNDRMKKFFRDDLYGSFVYTNLTKKEIGSIIDSYEELGASMEVVVREVEAFAVAKSISPKKLGSTIKQLCTRG